MTAERPAFAGVSLTVALGLHGSASTWVFNVLRELLIARYGEERLVARFADTAAQLLEAPDLAGRHVVWKTHRGGDGFDALAALAATRIVLSVRDPRDAVLSMMQRFRLSGPAAVKMLGEDCERAMRCAAAGCTVLRYEDGFFRGRTTVAILARLIGAEPPQEILDRVFDAYRTERVRAFAAALDRLPPQRRSGGEQLPHDKLTQIHRTHIGDGAVGKWRHAFDAEGRQALTANFAPFLQMFGYPA